MNNEKGYLDESLSKVERKVIMDALRGHNWSKTETAKSLGISRSTLYRKLNKYGINDQYEMERAF
jgi:DNA-binding NtrC family response regulator